MINKILYIEQYYDSCIIQPVKIKTALEIVSIKTFLQTLAHKKK